MVELSIVIHENRPKSNGGDLLMNNSYLSRQRQIRMNRQFGIEEGERAFHEHTKLQTYTKYCILLNIPAYAFGAISHKL